MLTIFRTSKDRNQRPDDSQRRPPVSPQPPQKPPQQVPPAKPAQQPVPPQQRQPQKMPPKTAPSMVQSATTIGRDLVFEGNVSGKGSIRVEGEFNGRLEVQNEVIIGEGGRVNGDIIAEIVTVEGNLKGNVDARKKININVTGTMVGDIVAPRVVVASGAVYKGRIDMESALKNAQSAKTPEKPGKNAGKPNKNKPVEPQLAESKEENNKIPGPPPKK